MLAVIIKCLVLTRIINYEAITPNSHAYSDIISAAPYFPDLIRCRAKIYQKQPTIVKHYFKKNTSVMQERKLLIAPRNNPIRADEIVPY